MELKFKEGDAVTVNARNFSGRESGSAALALRRLTPIMTVTQLDRSDRSLPYRVRDNEGHIAWVPERWLKARPRFGLGAKVVLDRSNKSYNYATPSSWDYGYELKDMVEPFTITDVDESDGTYRVEDAEGDWSWGEWDRFMAAPEEPAKSEKFIVCLTENGQLRPSTQPFEHTSRGAAAEEAVRLSKQHTNRLFTVVKIERLSTVKTIAKTETETVVEVCK